MNKFCISNSEDDMKKDISDKNNHLDAHTQIPNRQQFDLKFNEAIKKSKTTVSYLSILMIDINGQLSCNAYLLQIATILQDVLNRSGDLAARWDDKIFACILSDTDSAGAIKMAEKIRKKVLDLFILNSASTITQVTSVSIGVVTSILTDETSYDTLLKKADAALSAAKTMGGNQIYVSKS